METLLLQKPQWTPYDGDIARRLGLEKVRKQAQLILDWSLMVDRTGTIPSPQNLFTIRKKTNEETKTSNQEEAILKPIELDSSKKGEGELELAA